MPSESKPRRPKEWGRTTLLSRTWPSYWKKLSVRFAKRKFAARNRKPMRLARILPVLFCAISVLPLAAQQKEDWATPAEKADYRTTPNYDETMAYVRRITAAAPKQTKLISFGKTGEGR